MKRFTETRRKNVDSFSRRLPIMRLELLCFFSSFNYATNLK